MFSLLKTMICKKMFSKDNSIEKSWLCCLTIFNFLFSTQKCLFAFFNSAIRAILCPFAIFNSTISPILKVQCAIFIPHSFLPSLFSFLKVFLTPFKEFFTFRTFKLEIFKIDFPIIFCFILNF